MSSGSRRLQVESASARARSPPPARTPSVTSGASGAPGLKGMRIAPERFARKPPSRRASERPVERVSPWPGLRSRRRSTISVVWRVVEEIAADGGTAEAGAQQDAGVFEAAGGEDVALGPHQQPLAALVDRLDRLDPATGAAGPQARRDGLPTQVEAGMVEHSAEAVERREAGIDRAELAGRRAAAGGAALERLGTAGPGEAVRTGCRCGATARSIGLSGWGEGCVRPAARPSLAVAPLPSGAPETPSACSART